MKKFVAVLLTAALLLLPAPLSWPASAAGSDGIVDMRGTRTYVGLASDWSKTWDASHFKDVTGSSASWDGNLTVKAGVIGSLSAYGSLTVAGGTVGGANVSGNLTVTGGTVGDTVCTGSAIISGGILKSVAAGGNIGMTGGTVRQGVTSNGGSVTLNGKFPIGGSVTALSQVLFGGGSTTVSGSVSAADVTLNASASVSISGTVSVTGKLLLHAGTLTAQKIDGHGSAVVEADGFANRMPPLSGINVLHVDENKKAVLDQSLSLDTISLEKGSELVHYGSLDVNCISGSGTLCVDSGKLTIHQYVTGSPFLLFNDPVGSGTVAFRSEGGAVWEGSLQTYGYYFERMDAGSYSLFRLTPSGTQGVSLGLHSLAVKAGSSSSVSVLVSPDLSQYADGTQIIWRLDGDSSAFSISPGSKNAGCTVSATSSVSGSHRAVLTAYLADRNKDILSGYKSDTCVLTTGSEDSSVTLDTSYVSVLVGNKYGVLAKTNASTAPAAVSRDPSVVEVTGTKAVKDKDGNPAWLYTVTGKGNGSTAVEIGGSQMAVTVNSGILMDTMSYTMAPNASYCAGVLARGVDEKSIGVSSSSSSARVAFYKKGSDGVILYRVTGVQAGSADILFAVAGGQSVKMSVTVKPGAASFGKSARLVALKQ